MKQYKLGAQIWETFSKASVKQQQHTLDWEILIVEYEF